MPDNTQHESDPLAMFFDEDFNPSSYIDALFKAESVVPEAYSRENLLKLTNLSNNLIIQFNFYVNQLNEEVNKNLVKLNKAIIERNLNNSTRLNYFINLLENSVRNLSMSMSEFSQFHQLVVINKLISFRTIKSNITATLNNLKFIEVNLGSDLAVDSFESSLNALYKNITYIENKAEVAAIVDKLVDSQALFQNFTNFNSIYKKNLNRFVAEKESP